MPHPSERVSPARQRLIRLMADTGFGRIDNLVVANGDPVFDPLPWIVQDVKFTNDPPVRQTRSKHSAAETTPQVLQLLRCLDQIGSGVIERIEIKHRVPFLMSIGTHAVV